MNYAINSLLKWFKSNPIIAIATVLVLAIFIWYFQAKLWNGVGNAIFAARMSWQNRSVQKELESAAAQQKEIDKTLTELAVAKKEVESAKAETDRLVKVFNDQSKTAAEKVAEFKKAMATEPVTTATDGITSEDLCARAKALGASASVTAALCR